MPGIRISFSFSIKLFGITNCSSLIILLTTMSAYIKKLNGWADGKGVGLPPWQGSTLAKLNHNIASNLWQLLIFF